MVERKESIGLQQCRVLERGRHVLVQEEERF
jgi:hypothetical protein